MALPLAPPVPPMLARLVRELPRGDVLYEPKWDGFRALAFVDGDEVQLWSRHGRPLGRYFPELVEALRALEGAPFVVDGEIVGRGADGLHFPALMARLHPSAARVARLRAETPASYVAFDCLADPADLLEVPFAERRRRLQRVLEGAAPPLHLTPVTDEPALAASWLERFSGAGVDGVVAKARSGRYTPGKRTMLKVKRERTADCVVAGLRWLNAEDVIGSLVLGLYEGAELRHVGVATSFTGEARAALARELLPLATSIRGHPWERGFGLGRSPLGRLLGAAGRWDPAEMPLDWVPLRPVRVAEVVYDQLDAGRFRHPARFRRWRPDRDPRSCTFEQLESTLEAPVLLTP